MNEINCWQMLKANQPMVRASNSYTSLEKDEVLVRVAGCGVCHTDLGFLYDGVPTVHDLPLDTWA